MTFITSAPIAFAAVSVALMVTWTDGMRRLQAKIAADLQQKENEGKRRVYELRVQQLDETVTKQNEQIAELSRQLATALKQAQDLAIKAIDGASSSNSYAAVKEIALEQAKTSAKTK